MENLLDELSERSNASREHLSPLSPITCEIAMLGSRGLNAPAKIHRLQSIPGTISVLYLFFLQYAAFQLLDSAIDDVIDLSVEYLPDFWIYRGEMP